LIALALLAPLVPLAPLAALEVPYLSGRVNDLAEILPADSESRIETRLDQLEREEGSQVAVLTIPSLEGEVLEDYSMRVAETWKLGRGEFDDGALLLIASNDRKMRLEVGYGLEPTITDLASRRILDDVMAPYFRQGDFGGGVEAAVDVIARLIEGEDALPPPTAARQRRSGGAAELGSLVVVGFFSILALVSRGCLGWILFLMLTPVWFSAPLAMWGTPMGLAPGILWVIGFPWLRARLGRDGGSSGGGGWFSGGGGGGGWSSSGRGWSGGGFSGGGFSGGGGSFGGGGASGSW
jgi:uncharacterized protein